jgi:tetratricopeptide (TPR) repeat protein
VSASVPSRFVAALRRRAVLVFGVHALGVIGGCAYVAFVVACAAAGPVVGSAFAVAAWALVAMTAVAAAGVTLWPMGALRGSRVARYLGAVSPALVSMTRSALELEHDRDAASSAALVSAQRETAAETLTALRTADVIPWSLAWNRRAACVVSLVAVAAITHQLWPRAQAGAFALIHAADEDAKGSQFAMVVGSFDVRLTYPAYLRRAGSVLANPAVINAPKGTAVEVTVSARVKAKGGSLSVAGTEHALTLGADGKLHGRFMVHGGGPVVVYVNEGTQRLRDPAARALLPQADQAPRVVLQAPSTDLTVDASEVLAVAYGAEDDVALERVELVVQGMSGEPRRRTLAHFEGRAQPKSAGEAHFSPEELHAQPGDTVSLWIEAKDNDDVSGPNIGKSVVRRITIASESTARQEELLALAEVLAAGLDALADRLEFATRVVAGDGHNIVRVSLDRFVLALASAPPSGNGSNRGVLREMGRRLKAKATEEAALTTASTRSTAPLAKLRTALVAELERDVLLLSDLLDQGRIDDAAALAREIDALRREMKELLAEFRRSKSPEAKAKLLAAIQRAQARMQRLMERLAQMAKQVPSDFVNAGAFSQKATEDALRNLAAAVEQGKLDDAERLLGELEKQIDAMANSLGAGSESFEQGRMGPRQKALAEALDGLSGLESEQKRLAQRTAELRKTATRKALANMGPNDEQRFAPLVEQARKAMRSVEGVAKGGLDPEAQQIHDAAVQRLKDVSALLKARDLAEAQGMVQRATDAMAALARDLSLSSLMFPGREGETADKSRRAAGAAKEVSALEDAIDRAVPRMASFMGPGGEKQMDGDASRQRETRGAAQKLSEKFNEAPDGMPLDPDAANEMLDAAKRMADAEKALGERDPVGSSRAQEDAAEKLANLRKRLEQAQNQSQSGGGDSGQMSDREVVTIPSGDDHRSPTEVRRRLLDGMRERPPAGYENAVKRYYEELLR